MSGNVKLRNKSLVPRPRLPFQFKHCLSAGQSNREGKI